MVDSSSDITIPTKTVLSEGFLTMQTLTKWLASFSQEVLRTYAKRIEADMFGFANVRTGAMRESIRAVQIDKHTYFIGPHVPYAKYADQGRGEVKPVRKKALKFADGTFHQYARAYKGSHFVRKTANKYK